MLPEIWSLILEQFANTFKREAFLKNLMNFILVEQSAYKGWKMYENDCETKKNCITCYKKLLKHSHFEEDNPDIDMYDDSDFEEECYNWCLTTDGDDFCMYRCTDCRSYYVECENRDCKRWCNIESHCGYNHMSYLVKYIESKYNPIIQWNKEVFNKHNLEKYNETHNEQIKYVDQEEWFEDPNSEKYYIVPKDNGRNWIFRKGGDIDQAEYSYEGMKFKCPSLKVWALNGPGGGMANVWHCQHCDSTYSYMDK
jgi:hypothetical protein